MSPPDTKEEGRSILSEDTKKAKARQGKERNDYKIYVCSALPQSWWYFNISISLPLALTFVVIEIIFINENHSSLPQNFSTSTMISSAIVASLQN
jgi:hypothetical protein